jgi:hypothetical protein
MAEAKFWIVMSAANGPSPRPYRHERKFSARIEAERLARMHGGKFYVLEAITATERKDIETVVLKEVGIPF